MCCGMLALSIHKCNIHQLLKHIHFACVFERWKLVIQNLYFETNYKALKMPDPSTANNRSHKCRRFGIRSLVQHIDDAFQQKTTTHAKPMFSNVCVRGRCSVRLVFKMRLQVHGCSWPSMCVGVRLAMWLILIICLASVEKTIPYQNSEKGCAHARTVFLRRPSVLLQATCGWH